MAPTPIFLPGESHGQRSIAGYSPWGCKESHTAERLTHIQLIDFAVQQKLTQHCKSTILQYKIKTKQKCMTMNGLPRWLSGKESACNTGDTGLIPGS